MRYYPKLMTMKIQLTKKDKIELLKAVRSGTLDVMRVPALASALDGANIFEELMKQIDGGENI